MLTTSNLITWHILLFSLACHHSVQANIILRTMQPYDLSTLLHLTYWLWKLAHIYKNRQQIEPLRGGFCHLPQFDRLLQETQFKELWLLLKTICLPAGNFKETPGSWEKLLQSTKIWFWYCITQFIKLKLSLFQFCNKIK